MQLPRLLKFFLLKAKKSKRNTSSKDQDDKNFNDDVDSSSESRNIHSEQTDGKKSKKILTLTVEDLQNKRKALIRKYGYGIIFIAILFVIITAAFTVFESFGSGITGRANIKLKKDVELSIYGNKETWKIQVDNRIMGINKKLDNKFHEIRESTKQDAKDARQLISKSLASMEDRIARSVKQLNWIVEDVKDDFKQITDDTRAELAGAKVDIAAARETISKAEDSLKAYTDKQIKLSFLSLETKLLKQIDLNRAGLDKRQVTFVGGPQNIPSDASFLPLPGSMKSDSTWPLLAEDKSTFMDGVERNISKPVNITNQEVAEISEEEIILDLKAEDTYRFSEISDIESDSGVDYASIFDLQEAKKSKKEEDIPSLHIMTGFAEALLITGVSAPTFGEGLDNPIPAMFTVESELIVANDDTEDLEDCMLLGTATGNINNSRAEILITQISCSITQRDGKKFNIEHSGSPIGWVIGEDGKYGMKGRLVDSSGKLILRQIILGFLQGVGDAFANRADNNDGSTQISLGATSGAGTGVSNALSDLADHYKKMLDGMFPTIDVRAGRKVTVLFKGGDDVSEGKYSALAITQRRQDGEFSSKNIDGEEVRIDLQNW